MKDDRKLDTENLDDSVIAEEYQTGEIKKLKIKLKDVEAKAKEYLDGWQRAQADFVNLRKRDEEAKKEFMKFANTSLVEDLLPVLDSFGLALARVSEELDSPAHDQASGHSRPDQVLPREGVEMIYKQLLQILRQKGLEESNPEGEMFDPKLHESVGAIPVEDEKEDHKILEVVQKGYILSGKILRPAKVRIGEYKV